MLAYRKLRSNIPDPIKALLRPIRNRIVKKYSAELSYWKSRLEIDHGSFVNSHYEKYMLAMAQQENHDFIRDKVIADFGCGPRGSLFWAAEAKVRIGIDVLADRYADEFADNITAHNTVYVKCTEKVIPLPTNYVDVMFTLNAIDHVDNFELMCDEIIRVIKPGGIFVGSFNLEEPRSPAEPQTLNEERIKASLLDKLEIISYRVTAKGPKEDIYAPFFQNKLAYKKSEEGFLWVKARKQGVTPAS